jgi:redox-sensitive bicupin YhaK (pirin superfamily)
MISIRKSNDRGHNHMDWLDTYHTFSFADYTDENFMGFSVLRVINQDKVQPSHGFNKHPHKDMEIITYVISGELEHKDSMGTGSIIRPGEIQRMSAGTGVHHSEFNHSKKDILHLLQIWIQPGQQNITPSYEQKTIPKLENQLILMGSRDGSASGIQIHQDVKLYVAYLKLNHIIDYSIKPKRCIWIQVISGKLEINKNILEPGDGVAITDEKDIKLQALENNTEFLLFDLPGIL